MPKKKPHDYRIHPGDNSPTKEKEVRNAYLNFAASLKKKKTRSRVRSKRSLKLATETETGWPGVGHVDKSSPYLMEFGKHRGKPLIEVPRDYLEWFAKRPDISFAIAKTVRDFLAGRAA